LVWVKVGTKVDDVNHIKCASFGNTMEDRVQVEMGGLFFPGTKTKFEPADRTVANDPHYLDTHDLPTSRTAENTSCKVERGFFAHLYIKCNFFYHT
jgi:hypothetical protein